MHIILNFFQTLLIILSLIIWLFGGTVKLAQNKFIIFIIFLSLSIASFHSFILIDYDWGIVFNNFTINNVDTYFFRKNFKKYFLDYQ